MKFIFQDDETNLGRFGMVKRGDVLDLTEHEANCIKTDKRFKLATEKLLKVHQPGEFIEITDDMTPEEKAEAEKLNREEQSRLDVLKRQSDPHAMFAQTVKEMKFKQLEELAAKMNADAGQEVIKYDKRKTSKGALIGFILLAYRNLHGLQATVEEAATGAETNGDESGEGAGDESGGEAVKEGGS